MSGPDDSRQARLSLAAVDRADALLLHEQVAAEIRRAIADGEAKPGESIPKAQDLAAVLGVNTNTVLRALRILREEGLLELGRGRTIRVTGTIERVALTEKVRELVAMARRQGYGRDELVQLVQAMAEVEEEMSTRTEDHVESSAEDDLDAQALFAEARARRRRIRVSAAVVAVLIVAGVLVGADRSGLLGGGSSPSATLSWPANSASSASGAVVERTILTTFKTPGQLREVDWLAANGTVQVSTDYDSADQLVSYRRQVSSIENGYVVTEITVVFPAERAWASTSYRSNKCGTSCQAFQFFLPPSLVHHQLASGAWVVVGKARMADGQRVVPVEEPGIQALLRVEPKASYSEWLVDPTNDELVEYQDKPAPTWNLRWFPGTPSNEAHLALTIPSGYREVPKGCAAQGLPYPPTAQAPACFPLNKVSMSFAEGFDWGRSAGGPDHGGPAECTIERMNSYAAIVVAGDNSGDVSSNGDNFAQWHAGCLVGTKAA